MVVTTEPAVGRLGSAMLARADEIGTAMADLISRTVDFYDATSAIVSGTELRRSCIANTRYVFAALAGAGEADVSVAEETGVRRAAAAVPLPGVMAAYRVGFRHLWETTLAEARRLGDVSTDAILESMAQIMIAQDRFTQAMTDAYRRQATALILGQEEERSALVEAVLFGQITDTRSLWDAADILRLPTAGPFVVVNAEVPEIGRSGIPEIATKLDARDIKSAWRLLPESHVGIVHLRRPDTLDELLDVLRRAATTRIGVSPRFQQLAETGQALRFARMAISGRPTDGALVEVFDESPLAFAAVSAPDVMARIGRSVLGKFTELAPDERTVLVETFEAWLDAGGSANETAARIFVHPNTVRHRLRRIEEHTGRSLSRPRDVAELCLAFEVDRRLP